jgi:uncharacterized iron-regulated protein
MNIFRTLLICSITLILVGCGARSAQRWQAPLYQDHSLIGKIWSVTAERFISQTELLDSIASARFLLLGEKHDNPDHHILHREILTDIYRSGFLRSVSFEMLDSSQSEALVDREALIQLDDSALRKTLRWDDAGWDWSFYGAILGDVLLWNVSVRAANIDSAAVREIYAKETAPELEGYLNAEQLSQLTRQVDQSHCGMLPESQFPAMVRVQQARDLNMADSMKPVDGVSVLVAGNFHIRKDLGVPNYLGSDSKRALSLAFIEVSPESGNPQEYVDQFSGQAAYDYIWFTAGVTAEDYCASLRAN